MGNFKPTYVDPHATVSLYFALEGGRLERMGYEPLNGMNDINCDSEILLEVMRSLNLSSFFNKFYLKLQRGEEVRNGDGRLWCPIVNEGFDEEDSKTNGTGQRGTIACRGFCFINICLRETLLTTPKGAISWTCALA